MSRFSGGVRTAIGSTTLPIISLYAIAARTGALRELGLTNTAATAVNLVLRRLTSAGTQGASQTEGKHDPETVPAMDLRTTHTGNPGLGDDLGYRTTLGAVVGSAVIWTFGDKGLIIPAGTANGIGVLVGVGTGQIIDAYMVWDE